MVPIRGIGEEYDRISLSRVLSITRADGSHAHVVLCVMLTPGLPVTFAGLANRQLLNCDRTCPAAVTSGFARIRPETDRPTLLAAVLNRLPGNAGTGGTRVPEDPPPVTTRQRPKILPPLVFRIFALELSFYSWVRLGPETRQITRNLNWAIVRRQHLND